jgi:two-component system chemotaxis response regulator CheY
MKKVLVIDDSPYNVTLLTAILRKNNLEVISAKDGDEGLGKFSVSRPDIVLLDHMLPGRNGIEILKEMKTIDHQCIVVMITALNSAEDVKRAKEAGASGYIVKPFENEKIVSVLKKFNIL